MKYACFKDGKLIGTYDNVEDATLKIVNGEATDFVKYENDVELANIIASKVQSSTNKQKTEDNLKMVTKTIFSGIKKTTQWLDAQAERLANLAKSEKIDTENPPLDPTDEHLRDLRKRHEANKKFNKPKE